VNRKKQISIAGLHELAPIYALGALDASDQASFEQHLQQGCDSCTEDVRSFTDVANLIGESVPADPPKRLREKLLHSITHEPRVPGILLQQSGLLIARSDEFTWQPLAPGIFSKTLYQDAARKYQTALVRMDAGAHYPSHSHAEIEELFMLSGDLHVEGQLMRSGDYCRGDSGSVHGETFTDTGCLFLLMASQENQIVAPHAV
jgi:anti-sigma factor ChrR (cupin superfamily)